MTLPLSYKTDEREIDYVQYPMAGTVTIKVEINVGHYTI